MKPTSINFNPEHIESECAHDGKRSCPDLSVYDDDGLRRIFVEIKFWAGLTVAQSESCLYQLREDVPSARYFIVPEIRHFFLFGIN